MGRTVGVPSSQIERSLVICDALTNGQEWQESERSGAADCVRIIEWTEENPSHRALTKLNALGAKKFLRRPRPWMFHLVRLENMGEIGQYSHYFVATGGLFKVLRSSIALAEAHEDIDVYVDRTNDGIKKSQEFQVANSLLVPNAEDMDRFLMILDEGLVATNAASRAGSTKKGW